MLNPASAKKSLTVDSPAFTPKSGNVQPVKNLGISPKAATAATFTPRGSGECIAESRSMSATYNLQEQ